jgi:diadenosine tetraphosphate (Ap4A) HIT family hydrolase
VGGEVLWQDGFCRVVMVAEPDYPGFCRVILNKHVTEMTDLSSRQRSRMMKTVFATEAAIRAVMRADKINLASLGNAVPHLHWHVIPRFRDDRHFPRPIWAGSVRSRGQRPLAANAKMIAARLKALLGEASRQK